MNLPNKLSVLRILLIPVFVAVFFIKEIPLNFLIAAVIFLAASFTDFIDGKIARKYNMVTNLGKFLDPIADKVLVSTALIIMLVPVGETTILPWYGAIAVSVILARELMISGFRTVAAARNLILAADKSGKTKTFFQDTAILILLVGASVDKGLYSVTNIIGLSVLGIASVLTVYSGARYIVKNFSVLKENA
ncbi:MAG: CDP-diacylglycerol--glycerol-3-phosphate 3-phosphatidyltransferase [Clostridia bacterium]|nr:CDP-diacylglycerol--glycerol-3-phosphate 3-phosphatidyltransferase [Clostridia bacterium]